MNVVVVAEVMSLVDVVVCEEEKAGVKESEQGGVI